MFQTFESTGGVGVTVGKKQLTDVSQILMRSRKDIGLSYANEIMSLSVSSAI